jgi:hypothetical protein
MATMNFKSFGNFNVADYSHLSANDYQELLKKDYEEQRRRINEELLNQQKIQNMKYKIFNVKDLLSEIQYEGVRKGTKTEAYLENVIESINRTKKYRWNQFFQLVDVFYVVVEVLPLTTKNSQEETRDHYANVEDEFKNIESVPVRADRVETVKSETVSLKTDFPWKK